MHSLYLLPSKTSKSIRRLSVATIAKITYGYEVKSNEDAFTKLSAEATTSVLSLGLSGLTTVDIFPFRESNEYTAGYRT